MFSQMKKVTNEYTEYKSLLPNQDLNGHMTYVTYLHMYG